MRTSAVGVGPMPLAAILSSIVRPKERGSVREEPLCHPDRCSHHPSSEAALAPDNAPESSHFLDKRPAEARLDSLELRLQLTVNLVVGVCAEMKLLIFPLERTGVFPDVIEARLDFLELRSQLAVNLVVGVCAEMKLLIFPLERTGVFPDVIKDTPQLSSLQGICVQALRGPDQLFVGIRQVLSKRVVEGGKLVAEPLFADTHAEPRIALLDRLAQAVVARRFRKPLDRAWNAGTDGNHTQPMAMQEVEGRVAFLQFVQKASDPEVLLVNIGVMQQHDPSLRNLGQPGFEVIPYGLVSVITIDMKQVDAAVSELSGRLVERRPDQPGEGSKAALINLSYSLNNRLRVATGVLISLPCVDSETTGRESMPCYRLAHREIRIAGVSS